MSTRSARRSAGPTGYSVVEERHARFEQGNRESTQQIEEIRNWELPGTMTSNIWRCACLATKLEIELSSLSYIPTK